MSETIQMVNPAQSQAEMRAETPEDDLLRALEESEGALGKVNKPELAADQVLPEVIPVIEPVTKRAATSGPNIVYPEDIMPRGFEFKPSPDAIKLPGSSIPIHSEPTVAVLAEDSADISLDKFGTNVAETLFNAKEAITDDQAKAVLAENKAEEAELASAKIVHTNSGNFIGDDSETLGLTSQPPDGEDGLRRDDSLAQGSRNISIEINKTRGEKTMPPQQNTPELTSLAPEPVLAEMPGTGAMSELITPTLETKQTSTMPEASQDSQVVSDLVEGVGATVPNPETPTQLTNSETQAVANPVSEVQEQIPVPESQPVNALDGELPVSELVAESVMPTPKIEEIRSEVVSSEVPVEAPSLEPEAGVPEVGSANFRTMQKESDALGAELGAQIVDTQEKFENLLDKTEAHSQDILKNAQEVMAAASANIQRAQEERGRSEEILRIEEEENDRRTQEERDRIEKLHSKEKEEIARKRSENEEKFSRIVEKNNPILERSNELINEYSGSSSDQASPSESLEKTA